MSTPAKVPPAGVARAVDRIRHHLSRLRQRLVPPPVAMAELILGAWTSQALQVAAELRIADALADGPLRLSDLAVRVDADPDALGRLMRALISCGVFGQRRDGRYHLNGLADTLRSDAPISMAGAARFYGSTQHREHWSLLAESIRTGKSIVEPLRGMDFFAYLGTQPQYAALFNDAMTSISTAAVPSVVAAYDFSRHPTIVDVGGGHGGLLAAVLTAAPTSAGVLYDLPDVVAGAPDLLARHGVERRVRVESGSFFDAVPAGGDAYLLKHIIHDWPDEQAVTILQNIRAALGHDGTVLLVEFVIPEHQREFPGKWADLEMLLLGSSRERTAAEFRELLDKAGLRLTRIVPTASPFSIVEAARA